MLVSAGPRLLVEFSEEFSFWATAQQKQLGVETLIGHAVEDIRTDSISIAGKRLPVVLVMAAAWVSAPTSRMGVGHDGPGRTHPCERVPAVLGHKAVFAFGKVTSFTGEGGTLLPWLAQVAAQRVSIRKELVANIPMGCALAPFPYASRGNTVIFGCIAVLFEHERFRIKGWFG
jgi:NADH dehydrogenase FAD-containing subunit